MRYLDTHIADLIATLRRLELYDDALIVFTSDHGEEFWEHEGFEHGHAMYDETIRVPFLVKLPGAVRPSGPVDVAVSNQSITPTVLEVADLPYEAGDFTAPALVSRTEAGFELTVEPRPLVTSAMLYFEDRTAVVFDGFKYVRYHISDREELFDLEADPGERTNLREREHGRAPAGATAVHRAPRSRDRAAQALRHPGHRRGRPGRQNPGRSEVAGLRALVALFVQLLDDTPAERR